MFRSLFTGFTRAARLAALTVLSLGTLSTAAMAQGIFNGGWWTQPAAPITTPLRTYFTKLQCLDETDDGTFSNSDEPYVVILVADLRGSNDYAKVFASQTFSDVDKNETRSDMLQIWALDGNGAPIGSDDDYVMLAALLESDNSRNKSAIVNRLTTTFIPKLVTYKASGMSRSAIAYALRVDMEEAISISRNFSGVDDDPIGGIFEILWGANGLSAARAGHAVELHPEFVDDRGDKSRYKLTFRLQ